MKYYVCFFYIVLYYFYHERNVISLFATTTSSTITALTLSTSDIVENNTGNYYYHHPHHHHQRQQQRQQHNYNHINNNDLNKDKEQYIHIVLSFDSMTFPQAMVAIASIITTSIQPKRLFFHLILINMHWDSKTINDFQLSVGKSNDIIL
jgi:CBS domain containing-hemolysin-like protein